MPYISVVVPVYNVESYLSLCLQTIREQSLSDIEIICVNDGATDRSLSLLKLFAATDDRIRIIDKPNGGLSSARNVGILAARADYIMLVDSDDLLERDACEVVYASFVKHNADIVTFGANCYPSSEVDEWLTDCLGPRDVFYDAFSIDILVNEKSHPFVWRSAFSANFLKSTSLLFDETVLFGEDEVFYLAAYPRAQRVAFISKRLYNYRLARKDSLMSSRFADTLIRAKEHIVIVDRVLTDWKQQGWLDEYPMQILNWALDFIAGHIKAEAQMEQPELLKNLRVVLNRSISPSLIADSRVPGYTRELLLHLLDESTARVDTRIYNNWRFFSHSKTQRIVYARRLLTSACRKVLRRVLPVPASRNEQYLVDLESRISIRQEEELRAAKALQYLLAEYLEKKESHNLYPVTVEAVNKRISQH